MTKASGIFLRNVSLRYDVHYGQATSLKETVINFVHRRKYSDRRAESVHALKDVTLQIHDGERIGVIGRNGAGKSSLLKVISSILKPTSGEIRVDGQVQPLIEIAAGFNPEFSGRENIYLNGYMLGFSRAQIAAKEAEIVDFCELGSFIDMPVKYYSSGMSVRLAFTIATSVDPHYLIFDEMLAAGDAAFIEKAKNRVQQLVDRAKILIVVSHSLELIQQMCERCLVLDRGQIVFDGPPSAAIQFYQDSIGAEQPVFKVERVEYGEEVIDRVVVKIHIASQMQSGASLSWIVALRHNGDDVATLTGEGTFGDVREGLPISFDNLDRLQGNLLLAVYLRDQRGQTSVYEHVISRARTDHNQVRAKLLFGS